MAKNPLIKVVTITVPERNRRAIRFFPPSKRSPVHTLAGQGANSEIHWPAAISFPSAVANHSNRHGIGAKTFSILT